MSSETFTIASEPSATPEETQLIREAVYRFNFEATGRPDYHDIALLVRDPAGQIKGGLLGYVWADWLHVTDVWVAEPCRGRGLGGRLLAQAEQEAASLGAKGAFLSTFDFQAPGFYRARGYEVRASFADYPPGHTDYHLWKVFR